MNNGKRLGYVELSAAGAMAALPQSGHHESTETHRCMEQIIQNRTRYRLDTPSGQLLHYLAKKYIKYNNLYHIIDEWRSCRSGIEMIDSMHALVSPDVTVIGEHHLPKHGGCLLIANHPTGLTDGIALFEIVSRVRRDVAMYVFHELLEINKDAGDSLIPVDWRKEVKNGKVMRKSVSLTRQAFSNERLVAIFPSGRLSYWNGLRLKERPWQTGFVGLAKKFQVPLVPVHISGRNSLAYYFLSLLSDDFRDVQSIREMQNKYRAKYKLTFGRPIPFERLSGDPEQMAQKLQHYVERELPNGAQEPFAP